MRVPSILGSCLAAFAALVAAELNATDQSGSILPSTFKPPQTMEHTNFIRIITLSKSYVKETATLQVENTDKTAQSVYYLPFEESRVSRIGGFAVVDKRYPDKKLKAEVVEYDAESKTQYYQITFTTPLDPKEKVTLALSWTELSGLKPLPAAIDQAGKQYLQYTFSAFAPSAYKSRKQKTYVKFPSADFPDYTELDKNSEGKKDPQKDGNSLEYGPYADVPAGAVQQVSVRYEFTKPLLLATLLERDIEVSHWGGNLAIEERYWLTNEGARLKKQFSRVEWQQTQYYSPPTAAAKELKVPLAPGSLNPYFTDDIGNVSTSRFRSNAKEAHLELKPRYPIFGGWFYKFKIGWDADLNRSLRKLKAGDKYALKVPFMEGPKQPEGISYARFVLRVVLPEGATNVEYSTDVPLVASEVTTHQTFMDTLGRPTLKLTALNVVDDLREYDVVVTYDYPFLASFRKPIVIFASILGIFATAWVFSRIDVSIGRKR